jgi:glutamyl-Q tRNA(Asp) synthetase
MTDAHTRFAPAPTGYLHLGHVANAVFVWGLARSRGTSVILRVEDHDRQRSRPAYERALLDDLDWLGFVPDLFPPAAFRAGPCEGRQSNRLAHYESAAERLSRAGLLYGCRCSRQELGGAPPDTAGERRYPGTCRDRGIGLEPDVAWRVRLEPGIESFDDLILGPQTQEPAAQCGDLIVRDRLGNWTYQFVASVDDWLMGVNLVVRGRDLLPSTGRQIRIARLVGRSDPPSFAHHPLIMKSAAQKLSKSDRDTGVRDLRSSGWTAPSVIGEAAWRVGLTPAVGDVKAEEVAALFRTESR